MTCITLVCVSFPLQRNATETLLSRPRWNNSLANIILETDWKNNFPTVNKPIANFHQIRSAMPHLHDEIVKDLSGVQKYLYEICSVSRDGHCSTSLEVRQPGRP